MLKGEPSNTCHRLFSVAILAQVKFLKHGAAQVHICTDHIVGGMAQAMDAELAKHKPDSVDEAR